MLVSSRTILQTFRIILDDMVSGTIPTSPSSCKMLFEKVSNLNTNPCPCNAIGLLRKKTLVQPSIKRTALHSTLLLYQVKADSNCWYTPLFKLTRKLPPWNLWPLKNSHTGPIRDVFRCTLKCSINQLLFDMLKMHKLYICWHIASSPT